MIFHQTVNCSQIVSSIQLPSDLSLSQIDWLILRSSSEPIWSFVYYSPLNIGAIFVHCLQQQLFLRSVSICSLYALVDFLKKFSKNLVILLAWLALNSQIALSQPPDWKSQKPTKWEKPIRATKTMPAGYWTRWSASWRVRSGICRCLTSSNRSPSVSRVCSFQLFSNLKTLK